MKPSYINIDPARFQYSPELDFWVYPTKAAGEDGKFITVVKFSHAHNLAERHGLVLLTSGEWSAARREAEECDKLASLNPHQKPSKERNYLVGPAELTRSFVDFSGKSPVLWEGFDFGEDGRLCGGETTEVSWIPRKSNFVHGFNEELGLVADVGDEPNDKYHGAFYRVRPEGLRVILRGSDFKRPAYPECYRFGMGMVYDPTSDKLFQGFRVASKTGKVLIQEMVEHELEMSK